MPNDPPDVDLITTSEFATIARTSPETVRYWRYQGRGPAGIKVGRRVLYQRSDVHAWLRSLAETQRVGGGAAS